MLLASIITAQTTTQAKGSSPSLRLTSSSSKPLSLTPWKPRPVLGPQKTLILLVQFQDVRFGSPTQKIQSLMNTVDGWFRKSSYGKMSIDYTIHEDLMTLPNTMADYGAPKAGDQRGDDAERSKSYFYDSLSAIPDATLSQYRHIVLIHAGGDEAVTSDAYDIWSKCDCSGPIADEDPANEATWVITDQAGQITHAFWGVSTFSEDEPWPILAHEYSHSLGLADLYVYGTDGYSEGAGIGFWSNMATGAFLDPPSDIDGWSKYILGWVQAVPVNSNQGEYTIYSLDSPNEPKALLIPFGNSGEYYFIHARRKAGTDAALPSEGVVVFKINPNREQSLVGEELALISDANPTTPPQCTQYDDPFRDLCQEVDAPYNEKGLEYPFTFSTFTATIVLNDDAFWASEAGEGFKVAAAGDGAFKLTFASSPEALGITPSTTGTATSQSTATRCVIATAAYGSEMARDVVRMRYVRDSMIGSTLVGRRLVGAFNEFYYSWSPPVARLISSSLALRYIFRALLLPIVWIVEMAAGAFEVTVLITGDASAASVIAFSLAAFFSLFAYVGIPALVLRSGFRAMWRRSVGR